MEKPYTDISWQSLWRVLIFAVLAVLFFLSRGALGALLVAVVISLGLDPLISFFEKRKISRLLSTIVIFVLGVAIFAVTLYLVVPIVVNELIGFVTDFSAVLSNVFGVKLSPAVIRGITSDVNNVFGFLTASRVPLQSAVSNILRQAVFFMAVILISFYLSVEKNGAERLLRVVLPDAYERPVLTVFARFKVKIRRWFGAQLLLSLLVGLVVTVGLVIMKVDYPLLLGLLAAVFEIVPIIGPVVAGVSAFLVAVPQSLSLGLYVGIFFIVVQQLENHILIPLVVGRTMKVHPVIVIISLLAGGSVAGFFGVLLAVPIAVMLQEVFNYLAEQKEARVAGAG